MSGPDLSGRNSLGLTAVLRITGNGAAPKIAGVSVC
jgi:hypothetical protein